MKSKNRRAPAPPPESPAATLPTTGWDWSNNATALLVVVVLIACYAAVYFQQYDFRWSALILLFAPEQLVSAWTGKVDELPMGVFDRLPIILVAACIVAIAWAIGSLVLRGWKLDERLTRLETELFSTGLGLSIWSTWTLLIGLCGGLHQTWLLWLPGILATSVAGFQLAGRTAALRDRPPLLPRRANDWLWPSALWLGLPFAIVYILAGAVPPGEFDVLEYHLQAPKEWYAAGQITFLEHNVYANMPMGAEMYAILGMSIMPGESGWWYGALVGKTVLAMIGVLTALVLFAAGKRTGSNTAGVVAALVYLSTPWALLVSVTGYVEGTVAFYLALSVYAVWLWRMEPRDGTSGFFNHPAQLLQLAGFLAGSAAAVKYPSLLFVVLPLLLAVTLGHRKLDAKAGVIFLTCALLACGLWYAKNAVLTGNPVYPLAYSLFGGATRTPENAAQWNQAHQVPLDEYGARYSPEQFASALASWTLKSHWLSPLLLPLALLAALATPLRRTAFWLAALLAFFLLCWWLFTHRIDRFWTPALVLVAWLAGLGATWSQLKPWRHVLVALLFWGLVANFLLMTSWWYVPDAPDALPFNRFFTSLSALRNARMTPAHRYLNEQAPPGYGVLLVGDAQPFDLTAPAIYNTCFDEVQFDRLFQDRTREERFAALRDQKIAYVYFDWPEITRYRSPGNYGFSDYVTRALVYKELVQQQKLLKKVKVDGLKDSQGELFEVVGVLLKPE